MQHTGSGDTKLLLVTSEKRVVQGLECSLNVSDSMTDIFSEGSHCSYRKNNESTITDFLFQLSHENWDSVIGEKDVNLSFSSFLNSFLIIFNSCFPISHRAFSNRNGSKIAWITKGIKSSCKRKRELYTLMKKNLDISMKLYYKRYSKILSKVIIAAKRMAYDNHLKRSHNKMKTAWKFVNLETGRINKTNCTQQLIDKYKDQNVAEYLNKYFLTIADKLVNKADSNHPNNTAIDFRSFMEQAISKNYPPISNKPSTVHEIEKIIYSFKTKDSHSYDQISVRVLKLSAPYISSTLNYICNLIIVSGNYPERLKY
jgi:hypothetical protein